MTDRTAMVNGNKVEISFPFDEEIIEKVRAIAGRKFDWNRRVWTVPATPYHFDQLAEALMPYGFQLDDAIIKGADHKAPPPTIKFPKGLYPFQRESVKFMYDVNGRAILADEMGLGKTISALAFVKMFCDRTLVVCPANVVYKWGMEVERWLPDASYQIVTTGKDEIGRVDVVIMSYAMMVSHFEKLSRTPFDVIIFDECHYLKGRKSQRGKVGRTLVKLGVPKVLMLSGTPFLNRPDELFPLLNMLDPVGFSNFFDYAKRYMGAEYIQGMWYFPPGVVTNRDELAKRLERVMIRHTKKAVALELPDLTRTIVPVELTNKAAYKAALRDVMTWLRSKDRSVVNPSHALTRLAVLRQVVGEGKVAAAVELAESVLQDGKKVVLFAHHKAIITSLEEALKDYGVKTIVGDTPQKERLENSNLFLSDDSSCRVMVISTAGGVGIDLFSASDIIMVERQWTPAMEEQVEARLHRIGQKNPVNAYYIVARGTVDEKLSRIVDLKRGVIGQVISQDDVITQLLTEMMEEHPDE